MGKRNKRKHLAQRKMTKEQVADMMANKLRSAKHVNRKKYNRKHENDLPKEGYND